MLVKDINVQQYKNLTVVQFSTEKISEVDFVCGNEALLNKKLIMKEVSSSGNVNELAVINLSADYVFLMDGDILEGAKQNRVLNTSVLLPPGSKTILPVSCVEQGRWRYSSDNFKTTDVVAPSKIRAGKASSVYSSLMAEGKFSSDQSKVWSDVREFESDNQVHSPTDNLTDVFTKKSVDLNEFLNEFEIDKNANGVLFYIKKNITGTDIFGRKDIYREYFPKLLRSVSIETYRLKEIEKPDVRAAENETKEFIEKLEQIPVKAYQGAGVGKEKRFNANLITGFTLEYKENLIHRTALNITSRDKRNRL